jgi:hypothetical protein
MKGNFRKKERLKAGGLIVLNWENLDNVMDTSEKIPEGRRTRQGNNKRQ